MSMTKRILTQPVSDRWYTPPDLLAEIGRFLGDYYDPCPAKADGERIESGLWQSWSGLRIYCNPPYGSAIRAWIVKAMTEQVDELILLLPARTETAWFQPLYEHTLCFIRGRIRFSDCDSNAPFPSVLAYRGSRPTEFAKTFDRRGVIVRKFIP